MLPSPCSAPLVITAPPFPAVAGGLPPQLRQCLAAINDPRMGHCLHPLADILSTAICAMLVGAKSFVAMAVFAEAKLHWLRLNNYAQLPSGAPSHDTFRYVFSLLKPHVLHAQLRIALGVEGALEPGQHIAVDGKAARGTASPTWQRSAKHVLRAFITEAQLSIAYLPCDEKSNEITSLPELLAGLELKGCIVTIDAMGCQTEIAKQIANQGADWLFGLKGNQAGAHEAVEQEYVEPLVESIKLLDPHAHQPSTAQQKQLTEALLEGRPLVPLSPSQQRAARQAARAKVAEFDFHSTQQLSHGRYERRDVYVSHDLSRWPKSWKWEGVQSVIIVMRSTHRGGNRRESSPSQEVSIYLSSAKLSALRAGKLIRDHWKIENCEHHMLDVTFSEDHCQVRDDNAALNLAMVRGLVAHTLKRDPCKDSLPKKQFKAALSDDYRSALADRIFHIRHA